MIAPKIEELAEKNLDVVFLKLDCNQENKVWLSFDFYGYFITCHGYESRKFTSHFFQLHNNKGYILIILIIIAVTRLFVVF